MYQIALTHTPNQITFVFLLNVFNEFFDVVISIVFIVTPLNTRLHNILILKAFFTKKVTYA